MVLSQPTQEGVFNLIMISSSGSDVGLDSMCASLRLLIHPIHPPPFFTPASPSYT